MLGKKQEKLITEKLEPTEFNVKHFLYFEFVIVSLKKKGIQRRRTG